MTASTSAPRSRTKVFLLAILCATFVLLLPALSDSALAGLQKKGTIKPEETYNPRPDEHDIVLPMPDGLSMVFRVVAVPADGYLGYLELKAGRENTGKRAFYDWKYTARLSAPFSMNDIKGWSEKADISPNGKQQYFFYLIAKYEVTQKQWRAIMGEKPDPAPAGANSQQNEKIDPSDDARPITNISWFDAVEFTKRYTCWLLDNCPSALPYAAGDKRHPAFVRLPTEVEWEYAARGGQNASRQSLKIDQFFRMEEGSDFPDYAVYRVKGSSRGDDKPNKIGSRKPNPLGMYDTAGNVAEMTMDNFRFSAGGVLLGSAGGFVRKGGSFQSGEEEIMPGKREETPFFLKEGPQRQKDLGFRPVISGINTPDGDRLATIETEYNNAGKMGSSKKAATEWSPMAKLNELIDNPEYEGIKNDLEKLREDLRNASISRKNEQLVISTANIQHCLTLLESIHNYDLRLRIIMTQFATQFDKFKKELPKAKGERKKFLEDTLNKANKLEKDYTSAIKRTSEIYIDNLDDITESDRELNARSMEILAKDYEGNDFFNRSMRINLRVFKNHYESRIKRRTLTEKNILADLKKATKGK